MAIAHSFHIVWCSSQVLGRFAGDSGSWNASLEIGVRRYRIYWLLNFLKVNVLFHHVVDVLANNVDVGFHGFVIGVACDFHYCMRGHAIL